MASYKIAKDETLQSILSTNQGIASDVNGLSSSIDSLKNELVNAIENSASSSNSASSGNNSSTNGSSTPNITGTNASTLISNSTLNVTGGEQVVKDSTVSIHENTTPYFKIEGGTIHISGGLIDTTGSNWSIDTSERPIDPMDFIDGLTEFPNPTTAAVLHRLCYRGKNLGPSMTDSQLAMIQAGSFTNLWVGDYWERSITYQNSSGGNVTANVRMIIADFDYQTDIHQHHICVIPSNSLSASMNITADQDGYYRLLTQGMANHHLFRVQLPRVASAFKSFFGETHVLPFTDILTSNQSAPFTYVNVDNVYCALPQVAQYLGNTPQGTFSGYATGKLNDTSVPTYFLDTAPLAQFALFKQVEGIRCGIIAPSVGYYLTATPSPREINRVVSIWNRNNNGTITVSLNQSPPYGAHFIRPYAFIG